MNETGKQLITAIRVTKLFGLYTYSLPQQGSFSDASILYGDNGLGKSTILRLAFHLLSAADNRGHRNALYLTAFERFEVDLASGITVTASRDMNMDSGFLSLAVARSGKTLAIWDFKPRAELSEETQLLQQWAVQVRKGGSHKIVWRSATKEEKQQPSVPTGEKPFLETLKKYMPTVFILNADRRLDSDAVPDPSDEVELRRVMRYGEPKRINDLVTRSREIALSQAMSSAGKWIARQAVQAANQASMNVHTVYLKVLRHMTAPKGGKRSKTPSGAATAMQERLAHLERRTTELSKYEFETPLSTSEFQEVLRVPKKGTSQVVTDLLVPYVESSEGRLRALEQVYEITDQFVRTVNSFLVDKTLSYTLSHGFSVTNRLGVTLEPSQLSSGEQQLILLFCYVLSGRDQLSVFMIDEPEISLNIKWQRQLVQSLLDITRGARIQFLFASHSMELLAQHRHRVVQLGGQR